MSDIPPLTSTDTPDSSLQPATQLAAPTTPPNLGFRLPGDYYSSPASDVRPLFPKWVPLGCGTAALLFLIVLFAAGALVSSGATGGFLDYILGKFSTDFPHMYASDVTRPERADLESELAQLRVAVRAGRVPLTRLQPIFMEVSEASSDNTLHANEVVKLTGAIHSALETPPPPAKHK